MPLVTTYNPLPIAFTHGKGVWLYDKQGNAYLDSISGIGVTGLGHAHADITKTIQKQAEKLLHTSNMVQIEEQTQLAEKLLSLAKMEQAFFANSGAEANESAIKLARLYGHKKNIDTPSIIVMSGAFHGRTLATLTASGSRKVQAGFEPLVPGFIRAPYNDLAAIHTIAANRNDIVAVMLEPIQGEGGIHIADDAYLREVAHVCEQNDWLFIVDEIQTGVGRTGKLYSYLNWGGVYPDIVTTAKGLGNGIPISACLMRSKACDLFKPGKHGSTFGGNPFACIVASTVLDVIIRDGLCEKVSSLSIILKDKLFKALSEHPNVRGIRGKGYMIGIELDRPAADVRLVGLKHGLLLNVTAENVIRLLPPLVMNEEEVDELAQRLVKTIQEFLAV